MKRLTEYINQTPAIDISKLEFHFEANGLVGGDIARRLAAYEDTGLEPETVQRLIRSVSALESVGAIDHLKELTAAESDDRLVALPCKVGDTAYWVHGKEITICKVHRIQINRSGTFLCLRSTRSHGAFRVDLSLGKTVFLSLADAKAVLERGAKNEPR